MNEERLCYLGYRSVRSIYCRWRTPLKTRASPIDDRSLRVVGGFKRLTLLTISNGVSDLGNNFTQRRHKGCVSDIFHQNQILAVLMVIWLNDQLINHLTCLWTVTIKNLPHPTRAPGQSPYSSAGSESTSSKCLQLKSPLPSPFSVWTMPRWRTSKWFIEIHTICDLNGPKGTRT